MPGITDMAISYTAIVLDRASHEALKVLVPDGWDASKTCHHCTLNMGVWKGDPAILGTKAVIDVNGFVSDGKVCAVGVSIPAHLKTKAPPHVTVAVTGGGKPFQAGKLDFSITEQPPGMPSQLTGIVKEVEEGDYSLVESRQIFAFHEADDKEYPSQYKARGKRKSALDRATTMAQSDDPEVKKKGFEARARMEKKAAEKNNESVELLRALISEVLDEALSKKTKETLHKKARERGLTPGSVEAEYKKGLAAWGTSGSRPGVSQHAWAMARVNSATPSKDWATVKKSKSKKKRSNS